MFERALEYFESAIDSLAELGEIRRASIARTFGQQTVVQCNPCIDKDVKTHIEIDRMEQDRIVR